MAEYVAIEVKGLREVKAALLRYPPKLARKFVMTGIREALKIIQKDARRLAPRETGDLRRAIKIKRSKINTKPKRGRYGMYLHINKKNAYYGRFQHDGWNTHGQKTGGFLRDPSQRRAITNVFGTRTGRRTLPGRTNVPGKKFMLRAFRRKKKKSVRFFGRAMNKGVGVVNKQLGFD